MCSGVPTSVTLIKTQTIIMETTRQNEDLSKQEQARERKYENKAIVHLSKGTPPLADLSGYDITRNDTLEIFGYTLKGKRWTDFNYTEGFVRFAIPGDVIVFCDTSDRSLTFRHSHSAPCKITQKHTNDGTGITRQRSDTSSFSVISGATHEGSRPANRSIHNIGTVAKSAGNAGIVHTGTAASPSDCSAFCSAYTTASAVDSGDTRHIGISTSAHLGAETPQVPTVPMPKLPNSVHIKFITDVMKHGYKYRVSQPVNVTWSTTDADYVELVDGMLYIEYTYYNGTSHTTSIAQFDENGKQERLVVTLGRCDLHYNPHVTTGRFFHKGILGTKFGIVDKDGSPDGDSYYAITLTFFLRTGNQKEPSLPVKLKQPVWIVTSPQLKGKAKTEDTNNDDWVKDLTEEGIEPNPGPSVQQYRDHVNQIVTNELGLCWAKSLGVEVRQRLEMIWEKTNCEGLDIPADLRRPEPSLRRTHATQRTSPSNDEDQQRRTRPQTTNTGQVQNREQQYKDVLERVVGRLRGGGEVVLTKWSLSLSSRKWAIDVARQLWGMEWQNQQDLTVSQLNVYAFISGMSVGERKSILLDCDSRAGTHYDPVLLLSDIANVDYVHAQARLHNKKVHALNGNIFIKDMKDVDETATTRTILESPPQAPVFNPAIWETNITAEGADRWSQGNNTVKFFGPVRARRIGRDNTITEDRAVAYPLSPFTPLELLTDEIDAVTPADETEPIAFTFRYISALALEYPYNPLVPTDKYSKVVADITNSVSFKIRQNDSTVSGFSTDDVVSLLGTVNRLGLSMEQPLFKMLALARCLSYVDIDGSTPLCLLETYYPPAAGGSTAPEIFTDLPLELSCNDASAYSKVGYGDPPQADPDAPHNNDGSAQFEFPFGGGRGTVRFHVTLSTVPVRRRPYAVFMPAMLLGAKDNEKNTRLALFVMSLAPWPFGLYTISKGTVVSPQLTLTNHWLCNECMVDIAGMDEIDVVLPRTVATNMPMTLNDAQRYAVVRPQFGPTAVDDQVANGPINICYQDAQTNVPLVTYLLTYSVGCHSACVLEFLEDYASLCGASYTLPALDELLTYVTYRANPLVPVGDAKAVASAWGNYHQRTTRDQSVQAPQDTLGVVQQTLWGADLDTYIFTGAGPGAHKAQDAEDFMPYIVPMRRGRTSRFILYEFSANSWNKIALGLATASNIVYEDRRAMYGRLSNKKHTMWNMMTAMSFTIAWQIYYHSIGMPVKCWNSSFHQINPNPSFLRMLDNTFCSPRNDFDFPKPLFSDILRGITSTCLGFAPLKIEVVRNSGDVMSLDVFCRLLRPGSFCGQTLVEVHDNVPLRLSFDEMCPTILMDFWVHYFTLTTPKFMCAFPPPDGRSGTQGYDTKTGPGTMTTLFGQGNRIGPYVTQVVKQGVFPNNTFVELDDQTRWNMRIMWTDLRAIEILDYSSIAIVGAAFRTATTTVAVIDPAGAYIRPQNNSDVCCLCTTNLPITTINGYIPVTWTTLLARPASDLLKVMTRQNSTNREAWLLDDVVTQPYYMDNITDGTLFQKLLNTAKASFLDSGTALASVPVATGSIPLPQIPAPKLAPLVGDPGGGGGPGPSPASIAPVLPLTVESTRILESATGPAQ